MSTKHTPGPWTARDGGAWWTIDGPDGRTIQPNEANARVIAAAPELLEALREIAAGRLDHERGLDDFHDRARAIARAAIAKAEGKP